MPGRHGGRPDPDLKPNPENTVPKKKTPAPFRRPADTSRPRNHRDATLWLQERLSNSLFCDMLVRSGPDYTRQYVWRYLDDHVAALAGTVVAQIVAHAQTAALVPVADLTPEQVAARWTRLHGGGTVALYAGGGWLSITRNGRAQESVRVKTARFVLARNGTTEDTVCVTSRARRSFMDDLVRVHGAATFKPMGAVTGRTMRVSTDLGRGVRGIAASAGAILARRAKAKG